VPSLFLAIIEVSYVIQNETNMAKNNYFFFVYMSAHEGGGEFEPVTSASLGVVSTD
jgi:hypothetical protein